MAPRALCQGYTHRCNSSWHQTEYSLQFVRGVHLFAFRQQFMASDWVQSSVCGRGTPLCIPPTVDGIRLSTLSSVCWWHQTEYTVFSFLRASGWVLSLQFVGGVHFFTFRQQFMASDWVHSLQFVEGIRLSTQSSVCWRGTLLHVPPVPSYAPIQVLAFDC